MLATLIAPILFGTPLDFYANGPYDTRVVRPEVTLGYEIGSRITNFRDQERVLLGIANAASARVKEIQYGKSSEGRPLRIFAVSTPENIARLDQIRSEIGELAKGNATPERLANSPTIVWINECIHGNEPASFESAMPLLYNLAASQGSTITGMLKDVVVLINPVFNPDGHERYAVWYDSVATGATEREAYEMREPGVVYGRLNHYRFDMNRDHVALSQIETQQEVAELQRWNPQVYVDQHGQVETYFFPPNPMAINENVDRDRINHWTDVFGKATAKAFDQRGFLYYTRDWFDFFYPGYTDTFGALTGAIGMTHETDGGKQLAQKRADGSVLTLRQGIDKHFTSALAVIGSAAESRKDLLKSYADYKAGWVSGKAAGKFQRVVVKGDSRELGRLQDQLTRAGVTSSLRDNFKLAGGHDYWSDRVEEVRVQEPALVVDIAQPNGAIAKALLEPDAGFEPEFVKAQLAKKDSAPKDEDFPGPDGVEFYDMTAWSLPYAYNLRAWWFEKGEMATVRTLRSGPIPPAPSLGWRFNYTDEQDVAAAIEALQKGIRISVNTKTLDGVVSPGTFFVLRERNEGDWEAKLQQIAKARGVRLIPVNTAYPIEGRNGPGSETMRSLTAPKIGVIFGKDADLASVGSVWYLMEKEFRLPFVPLDASAVNGDLHDYSAIIVPGGVPMSLTPKLRDWVESGGHLVLLENYDWVLGEKGFATLDESKEKSQGLPGSLFRATIDPRSALSYGYPCPATGEIELAVPVGGSTFYRRATKGGSVVRFSADEKAKKLLSGWTFGDETERALTNTVWLQDQPTGQGHVVIFTQDPTSRAMWPGLHKLLLNAVLFGG